MQVIIMITMMMLVFLGGCSGIGADKLSPLDSSASVNGGLTGNITILARQYVTNSIHIPGGHLTTPYVISSPNTEYILDGDITADGTAISIQASKVVINLNGHTITYNQTVSGEGVASTIYNRTDVAVTNGSIIQGAAMSEGDVYGAGNNPVRARPYNVVRLQLTDLYVRYGGKDVNGFNLGGGSPLIENNTLEDTYEYGTVKNRHQGVDAIRVYGEHSIIRNNTIINARHRGVGSWHYSKVHHNTVGVRSVCTNAYGIWSGWGAHDVEIYNNTVTGRGEHPIGIGAKGPGSKNIDIHHNIIDVQTTRLGEEYGGDASCWNPATPCGNFAAGFRHTEDAANANVTGINFHDNIVTVRTDSAYMGTYSPTGESVLINGKGRGVMVGNESNSGVAYITNNTITLLDKDGTGTGSGLACTGFHTEGSVLVFNGNTVNTNLLHVALGDEYGACNGYPLFIQNTFVKVDNYPSYRTIGAGLIGYGVGTGIFISNIYESGAAETNLNMHFAILTNASSSKTKSIIFGRLMEATVRDGANSLLPNARVRIYNKSSILEEEKTTDTNGLAKFIVFDYELNNAGGTSGSATPIRIDFRPHTIDLYNLTTSQSMFTTAPDSTDGAWDALTSSGTHTLSDANGSITINTARR